MGGGMSHGHEGECALDVLEPMFGDEAMNIAMCYTCFPASCNVASKQAHELIERINIVERDAAFKEVMDEFDLEVEKMQERLKDNPA